MQHLPAESLLVTEPSLDIQMVEEDVEWAVDVMHVLYDAAMRDLRPRFEDSFETQILHTEVFLEWVDSVVQETVCDAPSPTVAMKTLFDANFVNKLFTVYSWDGAETLWDAFREWCRIKLECLPLRDVFKQNIMTTLDHNVQGTAGRTWRTTTTLQPGGKLRQDCGLWGDVHANVCQWVPLLPDHKRLYRATSWEDAQQLVFERACVFFDCSFLRATSKPRLFTRRWHLLSFFVGGCGCVGWSTILENPMHTCR